MSTRDGKIAKRREGGGGEEEGKEGEAEGKYKKKKTNKGVFVSEVYITRDRVVLLLEKASEGGPARGKSVCTTYQPVDLLCRQISLSNRAAEWPRSRGVSHFVAGGLPLPGETTPK